jgi:hypothetical protein
LSNQDRPRKGPEVKVAVTSVKAAERPARKCKFAGVIGCDGTHPLWTCMAFVNIAPEGRKMIIWDIRMCPFCLLHSTDNVCFAKPPAGARVQQAAHPVAVQDPNVGR